MLYSASKYDVLAQFFGHHTMMQHSAGVTKCTYIVDHARNDRSRCGSLVCANWQQHHNYINIIIWANTLQHSLPHNNQSFIRCIQNSEYMDIYVVTCACCWKTCIMRNEENVLKMHFDYATLQYLYLDDGKKKNADLLSYEWPHGIYNMYTICIYDWCMNVRIIYWIAPQTYRWRSLPVTINRVFDMIYIYIYKYMEEKYFPTLKIEQ